MRLAHLVFAAAAAVLSFSHPATALEKTRNLSGPVVHDEYSWPILGHWKMDDKDCEQLCEFIITPYSTHKARLDTVNDVLSGTPIAMYWQRDRIWKVVYNAKGQSFYVEEENGRLYDEFGSYWHRVK